MSSKQIINKKENKMKNKKEIQILEEKTYNYPLFENFIKMELNQYKIVNLIISRINDNLNLNKISNEDLIITITKEQLENKYETKVDSKKLAVQVDKLVSEKIIYTDNINKKNPNWGIINIFSYAEYDNNILEIQINKVAMNYLIETKFNFIQL